jgi:hypothetical protein
MRLATLWYIPYAVNKRSPTSNEPVGQDASPDNGYADNHEEGCPESLIKGNDIS